MWNVNMGLLCGVCLHFYELGVGKFFFGKVAVSLILFEQLHNNKNSKVKNLLVTYVVSARSSCFSF